MPVAGVTVEITASGHYGETWSSDGDDVIDTLQLVDQLSTLMPAPGEDRADIATELQRAGDLVVSLVAGIEAEKLFTTEPLPNTEHDFEEARAIAALICRSPRSVDAYLDFCRVEARALLVEHRNIVLAISDALLKHRTLDGAMIDETIRAVRMCSDFEAGR